MLALAGCGRAEVTGPSAVTEPQPAASTPAPPLIPPALLRGYFASAADAPAALAGNGNAVIVVPSWGEDATIVADTLARRNAFALVSAHHVFGSPPSTWTRDWPRTREWMGPIERTGRLIGIYVVDEPLTNGIPHSQVLDAIAIVRTAGYRSMVAEAFPRWNKERWRPPVDWFGVTAYYATNRVAEDVAAAPGIDVVFERSDDRQRGERLAAEYNKHLFLWAWGWAW